MKLARWSPQPRGPLNFLTHLGQDAHDFLDIVNAILGTVNVSVLTSRLQSCRIGWAKVAFRV